MSVARTGPVRVAVVNDYELVVVGVAALLEPYSDRVAVVELDSGLPVMTDVDVVLYDTFGQVQGERLDLAPLLSNPETKVAVFSWNVQPELVNESIEALEIGDMMRAGECYGRVVTRWAPAFSVTFSN